jgi:hypothetical protein
MGYARAKSDRFLILAALAPGSDGQCPQLRGIHRGRESFGLKPFEGDIEGELVEELICRASIGSAWGRGHPYKKLILISIEVTNRLKPCSGMNMMALVNNDGSKVFRIELIKALMKGRYRSDNDPLIASSTVPLLDSDPNVPKVSRDFLGRLINNLLPVRSEKNSPCRRQLQKLLDQKRCDYSFSGPRWKMEKDPVFPGSLPGKNRIHGLGLIGAWLKHCDLPWRRIIVTIRCSWRP